MTIIAAVRHHETVWIGSDTQAFCSGMRHDSGPKWAVHDGRACGLSGDLRAQIIMQEHAERLLTDLSGPFEFTQRFRALLAEYDFDLKPAERSAPPNTDQDIILVGDGRIWSVAGDLSFVERPTFWAEGSGRRFALGAMHAVKEQPAQETICCGMLAALEFDAGCGGEIWTHELR